MGKVLSVRVPDWVYESVESLSKKLGRRKSEVILDAIVEGLNILNRRARLLKKVEMILDTLRRSKLRIRGHVSIVDIVSEERE